MKTKTGWVVMALMVILVAEGCAKKSYIDVAYRLPDTSAVLTDRAVTIQTVDRRSDQEIFNPAAKANFDRFTGLFSLTLEKSDAPNRILGAYALPLLFEAAVRQRLTQMGVAVLESSGPETPRFEIAIDRFHIKLEDQRWAAEISYEASLFYPDRQVMRERVRGSAERLKVVGRVGAEKVIGEIFTEMINRLNVERLFAHASE